MSDVTAPAGSGQWAVGDDTPPAPHSPFPLPQATPDTPSAPTGPAVRLGIAALLLATLAVAVSYGAVLMPGETPAWAPWPMAIAVPVAIVATMVLGAARHGRVERVLAWPFALVGGLLLAGFALALGLPADEGPGSPLVMGLPLRAAIVLYGIGLLPIVILPVAYALTFEALTLRPEDLERVRAAGREFAARQAAARQAAEERA